MPLSGSDRIAPELSLGFDDVMIEPAAAYGTPQEVQLHTRFSSNIKLNIPLVLSSTDVNGAVAAAQAGGIGILPNTMSASKQADLVRHVKRFQSRIVRHVISVTPETSIVEALEYKQRYDVNFFPVVEGGTQVLAGFLIFNDADAYDDVEKTVSSYMSQDVVTVPEGTDLSDAYALMKEKNTSFVAIIDGQNRCTGLITQDDKQKSEKFPHATIDTNGALCVAAVVGTGEKEFDRVNTLIDAGVDVIVVQGDSQNKSVLDIITYIRRQRTGHVDVVAGNVCTSQAALALIDAGANGVIVGQCEDMLGLGIGIPSFTALLNASEAAGIHNVPVTFTGETQIDRLTKALAAGAHGLMIKDMNDYQTLLSQIKTALAHTGCDSLKEFSTQTRFVRLK